MATQLPRLADDGLLTPEVGSWGEEKYRLIANYAQMFSTAMKRKWDVRVYTDLFAGSGRVRLKGTKQVIGGSPTLALSVADPFDRYVFCEEDPKRMSALQERVKTLGASERVEFISGNMNENIGKVLAAIPKGSKEKKVLNFCFVDPFKMDNLKFKTIKALSARYIDFLILIPTFMDANRNPEVYRDPGNKIVDDYLGINDWRDSWKQRKDPAEKFGVFVLDNYRAQMKKLGFEYEGLDDIVEVRSDQKNLPLYHLAFFSRHPLGHNFWKKAKKSSDPQMRLFE